MPVKLVKGNVYLLHVIIPPQRLAREDVMTYMGRAENPEYTSWNARPIAGTQELKLEWIKKAVDLGKSQGREDQRHRLNRVVR